MKILRLSMLLASSLILYTVSYVAAHDKNAELMRGILLIRNVGNAEKAIKNGANPQEMSLHDVLKTYKFNPHPIDFNCEVIQCLVDHGAKIDQLDKYGKSELERAYEYNLFGFARVLIENDAHITETVLTLAREKENEFEAKNVANECLKEKGILHHE